MPGAMHVCAQFGYVFLCHIIMWTWTTTPDGTPTIITASESA